MKNDLVNSRNERRDLSARSETKMSIIAASANFHVTQTSAGHPTWSDFSAWQLWHGSSFPDPRPTPPVFPIFYGVNLQVETVHETKVWSRILFYHNAHYLLSGCMNLVFAISISLLVLVFPGRPAFALSELRFTVKRFRTLLRSVASASAILKAIVVRCLRHCSIERKSKLKSCDGFVIGVNLWSSFSLQVCSYDNGFIRRTPLQVAGGKRTSPPRVVCTCEHFNGKLVFYLKYLLFSFRLPPAWSSLCTGSILAGKAAKPVNFLQTAEEALVLSSNVGDAVLEQWSDKTFYHAAVRTTRVRTLYRYMYERS